MDRPPGLDVMATDTNIDTSFDPAQWPELDFNADDPFGFDDISQAWFGQQLVNLDWLELTQP